MATDTGSTNTLDYTNDIALVVTAIESVRSTLEAQNLLIDTTNTKINDQNLILEEIKQILDTMEERMSTETLGVYTNGVISELSRALIMTAIDEDRLNAIRDELQNPTPL